MDSVSPIAAGGGVAGYCAGEGLLVAAGTNFGTGRRRRPTLREADRLTDALRVTRAVLRRIATGSGNAADMEAVRSAIDAADAALGGTR